MSSDRSMRPPPIPQRKFAPGLALKPKIIDPYDPNALHVADNHTFMRSQSNAEQVSGTWTTIDPDTHVRSWGKRSRYQDSDSGSDSSNVRPQSRAGRASNNEMILSNVSHLETSTPDIDDSIRRHFVDAKDVMSNAWQARSAFEIRNQANLAPESATIIKNMIGDEVVSIAYQPIDDRVKYRDRKGNYIDGIDRGKMKKRYEDEWHKRLDDRDTEMKHVTKLKREFDALSPIEKTRRILRREANAKLLSILGAGLTTTDDLATFEYVPHIYLRLSKWTIRDQGSISDIPSSDNLGGLDDRRQPRDNGFNFRGPAPDIGYKPLSSHGDVTSGRGQSLQIAFEEDPAILLHVPEPRIFGQKPSYLANKHGPEQQIRDRSPVEARQPDAVPSKRKRPLHYRPVSDIPSRQYSAQSQPSQPRVVAQPSLADSARVSRTASSTASETVSALEPALDLAFLQDLTINRVDYENHHGSMNLYDRVKEVSSRRGRIVHVTLQEPVHFSSSAVVQRLFGGQIQEIQFFPAERMALVAFVVPSEAESFVTHVKNMRENHGHEFRRLQINAKWYKGLENESVYPAQLQTLAAVVCDSASRVILVSNVGTEKKVQDFAHDMKTSFTEKIVVKAAIVVPTKRYVQAASGNSGILEFASIKDAVEVKAMFHAKTILGYENSTAEWLADGCEKPRPKQIYCNCMGCEGEAPEVPFLIDAQPWKRS